VALTGSCTFTDPEREASVADKKVLRTIGLGFGTLTFAVTLVAIFLTINFSIP
jgi:hypothetical protein